MSRTGRVISFAEKRRSILETRSPAHWEQEEEARSNGMLGMVSGGALRNASDAGMEVKSIGPTDADRTFFQSIRLKLANNPLSKPFSQHPIIYACVHAISGSVCDASLDIVPSDREKAPPVTNELSDLIDDPNPLMSTAEFLYMIVVYLSTSGECILVKEGARGRVQSVSEVPVELWPLNGRLFQHEIDPDTKLVKKWVLRPNTPDQIEYKPHEIIHLRYPNPYDPYRGLAPLEAVTQTLMTDWAAMQYNEAFFKNGGDPGGVISVPRPLSDMQRGEIEDKFLSRHGGPSKAKRVMVLGAGAKYDSFAQSHRDMEYTDLREFARWEILSALRVPPAEAGFYEDVNNATAKEESKRYWTRTIFPIFSLIEDGMWSGMFRWIAGGKYCARFNRENIPELMADVGNLVEMADRLVKMGWTAEQASAKVGLDMPINEWQKRSWVSPNTVDAASMVEAADAVSDAEVVAPPTFNSSQVSSAQGILLAVAKGELGAEAAFQMLLQFFPGMSADAARAMITNAKPVVPAAVAAPVATGAPTTTSAPAAPSPIAPAPAVPASAAAPRVTPVAPAPAKIPEITPASVPEDRGHMRRRTYWKALHDQHYGPEEGKFKGMLRRYFVAMRAEQLRRASEGIKAFHSGAPQLFTTEEATEIRAWYKSLNDTTGMALRDASPEALFTRRLELHERAPKAIDRIIFDSDTWKRKLAEASAPHYARIVQGAQHRLAKEIGSATEWNPNSKAVKSLTETFAKKVTGITDTTRRNLRERIGEVVADGGGVSDVQSAIKDVFKVTLSRSLTIARTEVGGASNRASFIAMGEAGVEKMEWVSAGDELVRDSHRIDGEAVPVGKTFSNGLRFPHDPNGDAGDVINCRCDVAPVVGDDFDPDDNEDYIDEFDVEEK